MEANEKVVIRNLLFQRVSDPATRAMVIELASALSEEEDDFWAAVYHYGLPENLDDLNDDYAEFVVGARYGHHLSEGADRDEASVSQDVAGN